MTNEKQPAPRYQRSASKVLHLRFLWFVARLRQAKSVSDIKLTHYQVEGDCDGIAGVNHLPTF
jgi:hypothetical protein